MSDMYFQNLPNTSTPITAENLNKLNDVNVSRTQPTTGEKVWLTYTSNIISLLNGTYTDSGITATVSNNTITLNGTATATSFVRIPLNNLITLKANTNYTFSANNTESYGTSGNYASIRLHKTDNSDDTSTDVTFTNINSSNVVTKDTATSYLRLTVRTGSGIAYNNALIKPQLELGSNKTTYEPYVEKNIYIKNNNNIYEKLDFDNEMIIPISSLSGGANINSTYWRNILVKKGKLCHLELAVKPNSTNEITILQLPNKFYSTGNTSAIGLIQYQTTIGRLVIENSGAVKIQVPSNSTNTWNLNATWYVD